MSVFVVYPPAESGLPGSRFYACGIINDSGISNGHYEPRIVARKFSGYRLMLYINNIDRKMVDVSSAAGIKRALRDATTASLSREWTNTDLNGYFDAHARGYDSDCNMHSDVADGLYTALPLYHRAVGPIRLFRASAAHAMAAITIAKLWALFRDTQYTVEVTAAPSGASDVDVSLVIDAPSATTVAAQNAVTSGVTLSDLLEVVRRKWINMNIFAAIYKIDFMVTDATPIVRARLNVQRVILYEMLHSDSSRRRELAEQLDD